MAMSQQERAQMEQIWTARERTGAVEVRLHHIPVWFAKRCRAWLRKRNRLPSGWDNFAIVNEFARHIDWNLDHHGTSDRGEVFVNEPYPSTATVEENERAAELLGLELTESSASWWYPGFTTRFEFRRPEGEK